MIDTPPKPPQPMREIGSKIDKLDGHGVEFSVGSWFQVPGSEFGFANLEPGTRNPEPLFSPRHFEGFRFLLALSQGKRD
jgi:hypothetical protein